MSLSLGFLDRIPVKNWATAVYCFSLRFLLGNYTNTLAALGQWRKRAFTRWNFTNSTNEEEEEAVCLYILQSEDESAKNLNYEDGRNSWYLVSDHNAKISVSIEVYGPWTLLKISHMTHPLVKTCHLTFTNTQVKSNIYIYIYIYILERRVKK